MRKKLLTILLATTATFLLSACGQGEPLPEGNNSQNEEISNIESNEQPEKTENNGETVESNDLATITVDINELLEGANPDIDISVGKAPSKEAEKETEKETKSNAKKAPDFTATLVGGNEFKLSDQEGKVVLLNFWATWCGPCVGEMPAFQKLYDEYDKDSLFIIAVDFMESQKTVDKFLTSKGYTFPVAYDTDGKIGDLYPTDGIPYTLVIGKDGTIQKTFLGANGADAQYREYKKAIDAVMNK